MPELPEVETIVRELNASVLTGCRITDVEVYWPRTIAELTPAEFSLLLKGRRIDSISRHGKWLRFTLDRGELYVHLRMTGKFFFGLPSDAVHSHERVRLLLNDGRCLRFEDQRKFGRWRLAHGAAAAPPAVGIDPLSPAFTFEAFKTLLKHHRQVLKPFLLNQRYLAGLGNIYVDESLWEAALHPRRHTDTLTAKEAKALFKAIPEVLKKGIENTGTSLGNTQANYYSVSGRRGSNQHRLNAFRRQGLPCPRCGAAIVKTVVAQRGTHFCPRCQRV